MIQDCLRQRRTLFGVCACAEFVKQHKRIGRCRRQNPYDIAYMRTESGDGLLDALLIAHIGIDTVEHGQRAAFVGGDLQARLAHQRKQAHRLHRNRLAAGVGSGNYQHRPSGPHAHIDRHGVSAKQRMARVDEAHAYIGIDVCCAAARCGWNAANCVAIARARHNEV